MSQLSRDVIEKALKGVEGPQGNVIDSGLISGITVRGGKVGFVMTVSGEDPTSMNSLRATCEQTVKSIPGVESVTAVLTAESSLQPEVRKPAVWNRAPVEHVKKVVAVASGKGGVGKSTTAVNLAHALAASGKRVGLLDADIYGPSIPHMLGLSGQPEITDGKMMPLINSGIKCMSVGFITGNEAAIMRGPMISKTLTQLLRATRWGNEKEPLDILLIDMPPGTGDIHLSLAQQAPLDGVIIVTTPQAVATIDAKKCLIMFQKVNVPVLGVVENMSGGIFGTGGGKTLAAEMQVPFLGEIPMEAGIAAATDQAKAYKNEAYTGIARSLA